MIQYPTTPLDALSQIEDFFNQGHDVKHLALGLYELVGFGLNLMVGMPAASAPVTLDPHQMAQACQRCTSAMATTQSSALPGWVKPIVITIIQSILTYLQGASVQQHFAATGKVAP